MLETEEYKKLNHGRDMVRGSKLEEGRHCREGGGGGGLGEGSTKKGHNDGHREARRRMIQANELGVT